MTKQLTLITSLLILTGMSAGCRREPTVTSEPEATSAAAAETSAPSRSEYDIRHSATTKTDVARRQLSDIPIKDPSDRAGIAKHGIEFATQALAEYELLIDHFEQLQQPGPAARYRIAHTYAYYLGISLYALWREYSGIDETLGGYWEKDEGLWLRAEHLVQVLDTIPAINAQDILNVHVALTQALIAIIHLEPQKIDQIEKLYELDLRLLGIDVFAENFRHDRALAQAEIGAWIVLQKGSIMRDAGGFPDWRAFEHSCGAINGLGRPPNRLQYRYDQAKTRCADWAKFRDASF
jgi:hypothetical protein